ncbi:TonB-dependent receptor [Pseudoduganella namucuonensis]|uniref:TonB-dependent receptor n=1 Tax=Pseudoduganella namucuonensis TaxID=1035707 RepID=A0A1I7LH72_9BURK|nr:TonB-dependent receptor [Pseudoduganella namucuonensis]SFV09030.1 TonB-dependent receptor [Pseudoduganella namucuonensis]
MNTKLKLSLKATGIALAVSQAFAPNAMAQAAADESAVIVVKGIRASARSSVAIKRDTMEVVDSITADDIGKLPDPNVAETLTRIPGVQGYRFGGEGASPSGNGSGLGIRGLTGQTASVMNGRKFFTAGSREYNIEGAIPGMIAGVDVYKNPSAEHIEGAIGGLINIRTRNPSDFKGFTAALNANLRYNDLEKQKDPELFGLIANRFDLGGGSRIGVMAAVAYQKSAGRSDSTAGNRGPDYRRVVRADSAEYASLAAANTGNNPNLPSSTYAGRKDVSYLAGVPTFPTSSTVGRNMPNTAGLSADQISNIVAQPGMLANVFQETIMRERRGLNLAADYRVSNTLRFFTEFNYTYYLYHQNYRFNFIDNGTHVQNLQTAPFPMTEGRANRNWNGGSDDVLSANRVMSGTFLNSSLRPWGGDEHTPYRTGIAVAGAEWSPTSDLSLKGDFNIIRSDKKQDNRRVEMAGAAGKLWDVSRFAEGETNRIGFSGPSLSDPANFVFSNYESAAYNTWDDKGHAASLSGVYSLDNGPFSHLKFGTRFATQESMFKNFGFGGRRLTTNGKDLAADRSNGILVSTKPGVLQNAPTNYMDGRAGFSGGYVVYSPDALLGNQVAQQFPNAGIPAEGAYVENAWGRRFMTEDTLAGYLTGEFSALDERVKGSVGVRVVRTETSATARVASPTIANTFVDHTETSSYNNVLPTFNATYTIAPDFLARFAYGRGMTRPNPDLLNPAISVNTVNGTGSMGNTALRPQVADSFDLSLERYFSGTNYVSAAVFAKNIDGFFNKVSNCRTVDVYPAYAGIENNGCAPGQYLISQDINAEKGWARGVELAGQWFFDAKDNWLRDFGVAASYTFVDTSNPINIGDSVNKRIVDTIQPFVSKHSYSLSGLYEGKKLSGRVVYTWRSSQQLGNIGQGPIGGSYVNPYGILDASLNYAIDDHLTLSVSASNLTNVTPQRMIGEAQTHETGMGAQLMANGRMFAAGLRYKF